MASSSARYRVTQPLGSPPTLRTGYVRVQVYCNSCRHQADADLRALVLRGQGDVPLTELRFRCSQCGTDRTDFVVTSRDNPQPW
jgi:transposase-like protein